MAVFVPLTAVGDKAKVKILKVKKTYAYAKVEEILTPSPDRITPACPVYLKCGGCVFSHMTYEAEKEIKANHVKECFKRIGGVDPEFEPIIGGETDKRYRNKAQYPLSASLNAGFYAFHSHRVVPCNDCRLQPQEFS